MSVSTGREASSSIPIGPVAAAEFLQAPTMLEIRKDAALDLLSLGALVHRLDPGIIPFRKAHECHIHVSGGEFNVAANLADCFGLETGVATAMVDYPIGDLVSERVKAMGVKPFYKRFHHDGVTGPNIASVYSDRGHGVRAPVVFYNRANEAAARLKPGDFDWNAIFGRGVRWFHSGGIFAALSETTAELIIEGMRAAKAAGAVVSFDLNFRAKLWNISGGQDRAVAVIGRIVDHVDVLVGNEEDLQKGLGIPGPEVTSKSKLDPGAFFGMIESVIARHPQIRIVATTLREVHSTNHHQMGRRRVGRRKNACLPHLRASRPRSRRRRRRIRVRILLRPSRGRVCRRIHEARLGPRRTPDYVSRRHHHGNSRSSPFLRLGSHPALMWRKPRLAASPSGDDVGLKPTLQAEACATFQNNTTSPPSEYTLAHSRSPESRSPAHPDRQSTTSPTPPPRESR